MHRCDDRVGLLISRPKFIFRAAHTPHFSLTLALSLSDLNIMVSVQTYHACIYAALLSNFPLLLPAASAIGSSQPAAIGWIQRAATDTDMQQHRLSGCAGMRMGVQLRSGGPAACVAVAVGRRVRCIAARGRVRLSDDDFVTFFFVADTFALSLSLPFLLFSSLSHISFAALLPLPACRDVVFRSVCDIAADALAGIENC